MPLSINMIPHSWKKRPEVLLSPNIPKPMHGVAPRIVLGQKWWDRTRKAAYASTNFHCIACGVYRRRRGGGPLHGHELYEIDYLLGRMYYKETVPLCQYCHNFIHSGRLEMMRRKGEVTDEEYQRIITHGTSILKSIGVVKPQPYSGSTAAWEDWRMIVEGKEYPPIFRNYDEWARNFKVD